MKKEILLRLPHTVKALQIDGVIGHMRRGIVMQATEGVCDPLRAGNPESIGPPCRLGLFGGKNAIANSSGLGCFDSRDPMLKPNHRNIDRPVEYVLIVADHHLLAAPNVVDGHGSRSGEINVVEDQAQVAREGFNSTAMFARVQPAVMDDLIRKLLRCCRFAHAPPAA